MDKYTLTKTQRNEVLKAIERAGLAPDSFVWRETGSPIYYGGGDAPLVSQLTHLPTRAEFTFDYGGEAEAWWAVFSPAEGRPYESTDVGAWGGQLAALSQWLTVVRREAEAPDLWAAFAGAPSLVPFPLVEFRASRP